jgi:hypothetical protein
MTREELIEKGVNFENMNYPFGEMNIIVQQFATLKKDLEDDAVLTANPDIYQPRKNRVWSCGCSGDGVNISTDDECKDYASHLRDSAERLKIMSIILSQQANELEEFGEIRTSLYYPEESDKYTK